MDDDAFADRYGRTAGLMTAMEKLDALRVQEATPQQRAASGASVSGTGLVDPYDASNGYASSYGFRAIGRGRGPREIPERTLQIARTDSITAYRVNPIGRAIVDTYTAFCTGDNGLLISCAAPAVKDVVDRFWSDPRNAMVNGQELMFRDWLLQGEQLQEMMVGPMTGVCRRNPIDVSRVLEVSNRGGNPLWPEAVAIRNHGTDDPTVVSVIGMDDVAGLRMGEAFWWPAFQTLESDTRGAPFLMPILDWLDSYDLVLSNLIDRTALMRYISWDVTLKGPSADPEAWVEKRGSRQIPRSGTMEVHNDQVEMKPVTATTGAYEDVQTLQAIMTMEAAGAGLAKTWLAEPEDANRATSLTMAEPVRRRVGSVQKQWIANVTEMVRFVVDQAVFAGRIDALQPVKHQDGSVSYVSASQTVSIEGPSIAAADDKVTAEVMLNVAQALQAMHAAGALTPEARDLVALATARQFGVADADLDAAMVKAAGTGDGTDVAPAVANSGARVPLAAV